MRKLIMENLAHPTTMNLLNRLTCPAIILALALNLSPAVAAAEAPTTFATPDEAASSLAAAVKKQDQNALRAIFGPAAADIENPDRVQATNEFHSVAAALDASSRLVQESATKWTLEIGTNSWPFPIPIVLREGRWLFDTAAGKEEIKNRRIGKNEIEVLASMRAYVDAQREYASKDRDGDEVLEYAQKIASSPGQTDGLFWEPETNGETSPLGPMVANAQAQGYFGDSLKAELGPQPFHGYFFKILTRQGKHVPGGKYNYIINGNMIGGFAMVAWPASYGDSGIMTFVVNQLGRVYQKDLGERSAKIAGKMSEYDPDETWQVSRD